MLRSESMAEKRIKNELDTDYVVIGIATSLKEYKLCFHLNALLECDFRKLKDITFEPVDRTRTSQFSVFKAVSPDNQLQYIVFANKNGGEVLLPEAGSFDFLLRITGHPESEKLAEMVDGIRNMPEVLLTAEIPGRKIKNRERLVYEEEKAPRKLITTKRFKL